MSSSDTQQSDEWSQVLSPRELEVALLVARGFSNKMVALELGLSCGTVKVHVHSIFQKLGTTRRHRLIFLASSLQAADKSTA